VGAYPAREEVAWIEYWRYFVLVDGEARKTERDQWSELKSYFAMYSSAVGDLAAASLIWEVC
jgi:hypothetical protein